MAEAKGRIRQRRGEITRNRILDAAIDVIADVGFAAATHRRIAAAADVRLALTTYYFDNLTDLHVHAIRRHFEQRKLVQAGRWDNAREQLELILGQGLSRDELVAYLTEFGVNMIETMLSGPLKGVRIDIALLYGQY